MVVEDESLIALDIERRLIRLGYEVVGVTDNRDDAVELFQSSLPDLILMDISIRGPADGIDTARAIGQLGDVPVVFLTAYADDVTLGRATEVSPYGYLLKPFDERTLAASIKVALERHAGDARLRVLSAAVSTATIGIMLVDAQGDDRRISYVNDAFTRMSGAPREMILGQLPCFLARDPNAGASLRLQSAVQNLTHASENVEGRRMSGEPFWSTVTISPVPDRSGRVRHVLVFHMDVTREREAQSALAESQRLEVVGQLTAGIAHDFNNILGVIVAFADLARESVESPTVRNDLDEVVQAARRGALLTRKLLDFSRRDEADRVVSADLSRVIGDAWPMVDRLAGPGFTVDLRLDPGPTVVGLDPTSVEQILLNLVANARDAMANGGKITVAVTRPVVAAEAGVSRRIARLEVADHGTGMDPATVARVFDPLFTTKPRGRGTGLGLSTCKMLVEGAGGSIGVETVLGEGSSFVIDLPLVEAARHEAPSETGPVGHAGGASCLLVDDDGPLRTACARALTDAGFQVTEASDGDAACRLLDTLGPSLRLLVCDMVLPRRTGSQVLEYARKTAPQAERLVITGYFDASTEVIGPGVSTLWKPFTLTSLVRRALDVIDAKSQTSPEPAPSAAPQAPVVVPARSGKTEGESGTVLLVDDDAALRRALASMLMGQGLRVVEAGSFSEALEAVDAHEGEEFQIAVLDVNLPDASGLDLPAELRKRDGQLPMLVMTGDPSIENAQRALRGRASGFLTKPIPQSVFLDEVTRVMSEGQIARLQHKLLLSKAASSSMLSDLAATESSFATSVAGLHMVYQPIVRPHDRTIFAFEALMRSRGPYLNPGDMLAAGEALGRVGDLGHAVRRSIAATLVNHPERYEPIFVNLHPTELRPDLLLRDDEPLLPVASRIVLEVTERAQLSSSMDLGDCLRSLRSAGYRIALDDLGEGYAGLSWLVKIAPDIAKLDMSLVRDIHESRMKRELVGSLVSVCRRAGTLVVAEGVETAAEAAVLTDLGCDLLQGYFFARPGPPFPEVS